MLHSNGPWINKDGILINQYADTSVSPYDMAIGLAIDEDDATFLKCGDAAFVTQYMQLFYQRCVSIMPYDKPEIRIIHFTNYEFLNPDDICTLTNYLLNHISKDQMTTLLNLSPDNLKKRITQLQSFGF